MDNMENKTQKNAERERSLTPLPMCSANAVQETRAAGGLGVGPRWSTAEERQHAELCDFRRG